MRLKLFILLLTITFTSKASNLDFTTQFKFITIDDLTPTVIDNNTYFELNINNKLNKNTTILIEISIQEVNQMCIYQTVNQVEIANICSEKKPIIKRKYFDRELIYEFDLVANSENKFILTSANNNLLKNTVHPIVWKKSVRIYKNQALELSRGIFYGILILYIIICLIIYLIIKQKNYLFFFIYLTLGAMYLFIKNNLAFEVLWSNYPNLDDFLRIIILYAFVIASFTFIKNYIFIRIISKPQELLFNIIIYIGVLNILASTIIGILFSNTQTILINIDIIFIYISSIVFTLNLITLYKQLKLNNLLFISITHLLSFLFFIFFPTLSITKYTSGFYVGQFLAYSNAFFIAIIISSTTIWRALSIIKQNEIAQNDLSSFKANQNFSIINGEMNERKRIGQELHDGIGILMALMKMKISGKKFNDKEKKIQQEQIIQDIDVLAQSVRELSHQLMPPALYKFGLEVALNDLIAENKNNIDFKYNIPNNLNEVSQYLIYNIFVDILSYYKGSSASKITLKIFIFPSIQKAQIKWLHNGDAFNNNNLYYKNIINVINILHGNISVVMQNIWSYKINMEFPILIAED
ncbi:MAG: hypothetical protein H6553_08410 [Chitinophagales bacterium]|nr:hypothetical protein [Chitinophagales bacterium]